MFLDCQKRNAGLAYSILAVISFKIVFFGTYKYIAIPSFFPCCESTVEAIQKPLSGLKNILQKPSEAFEGFRWQIYRPSGKIYADTLPDFAIHRRQNETSSRKSTHVNTMDVHSAVSRGRLMQQACRSVTLTFPLIFFHRGNYNNNSPGSLQYHHHNSSV
jgi:hypothetical protein